MGGKRVEVVLCVTINVVISFYLKVGDDDACYNYLYLHRVHRTSSSSWNKKIYNSQDIIASL